MPSKRRYPPAKARYRASHPSVGVTMTREVYARVQALKEETGLPLGNLVLQALGVIERNVGNAAKRAHASGRQRGRSEGYSDGHARGRSEGQRAGYEQARGRFAIVYPCYVCGEGMAMEPDSEPARVALRRLADSRWGHKACHEQRRMT